jgi:hypothetical protein
MNKYNVADGKQSVAVHKEKEVVSRQPSIGSVPPFACDMRDGVTKLHSEANHCCVIIAMSVRFFAFNFFMIWRKWTFTVPSQIHN